MIDGDSDSRMMPIRTSSYKIDFKRVTTDSELPNVIALLNHARPTNAAATTMAKTTFQIYSADK